MANLSVQILAGVPDCIHANEGYVYPKPAVQLTEGVSAYSVSPSIATYAHGNAIKYSSLEESAYTSITPAPLIKQAVYSAPLITKSYVTPAPIITKSYLPPIAPIATVAPAYASVTPAITKAYLPPVSQLAYTAPLSKVATYTPTSSIVSIPAVKSVAYQYPKYTAGYQAASVAYVFSKNIFSIYQKQIELNKSIDCSS